MQPSNQVSTKQGYLCLLLLLVALVFSSLASLKMTLSMLPDGSTMDAMPMVHVDTQEHQHCHSDTAASNCKVSDDGGHDHQGCTQAHCSTLPVLATPFDFISVAHHVEQSEFSSPMTLSGEPNMPYIPPIA
ncbi:hypothetical protein MAQ5080_02587 [Marinomonas aquimarina]|uniref:Uncharacterized protein n=1 Tax=Marinomonas aquimarina TaxID=295068 RepID=A0A1A8TLR9_9GAMM|nr:hypothetical protein [Marinomonas aquimarina]SBS33457.1 hypothetical protein MAQ5080_02587 [Marinomonas aquimarina]